MGIFNKLFGKKTIDTRLNGNWRLDSTDFESKEKFGDVYICFDNGSMTYDIFNAEKLQRILLTYYIQDEFIISNQPSQPREEKSKYRFSDPDTLIIEFEGVASVFKRIV